MLLLTLVTHCAVNLENVFTLPKSLYPFVISLHVLMPPKALDSPTSYAVFHQV
jgi:hypothetical protein